MKKSFFEFGDKVTDVCDTPEKNYIVLKVARDVLVMNKNLISYKIHKLRLRLGWNKRLKK